MASSHLILPTSPIPSRNFEASVGDPSQKGTLVSRSCTPGANMMQDMTTVTSSKKPYIILDAVEFLQLGHKAHPAVQAVEVKQQAKLVRLKIPPILYVKYI